MLATMPFFDSRMVRVAGVRLLTMPMSFGCEVHVGGLFRATHPTFRRAGRGGNPWSKSVRNPFPALSVFHRVFRR